MQKTQPPQDKGVQSNGFRRVDQTQKTLIAEILIVEFNTQRVSRRFETKIARVLF